MKHGERVRSNPMTPEYQAWKNMRRRCSDKSRREYPRYGGRGIGVCARWQDFAAFLSDMGRRPGAGYSIEREDNGRGYEPGNCRWATATEQARNRRTNRMVDLAGAPMPLAQACEITGLNAPAVLARISRCGWSVERALSEPITPRRRIANDQRMAIRQAAGTMQRIADSFGVGIATVWKIKHGKQATEVRQ